MQLELKRTERERENVISMCILPIYEFRIECVSIQFNIPCQFHTAIHEQILDQISTRQLYLFQRLRHSLSLPVTKVKEH